MAVLLALVTVILLFTLIIFDSEKRICKKNIQDLKEENEKLKLQVSDWREKYFNKNT